MNQKKKAMGVFLFFFRFASDSLCMVGLWVAGGERKRTFSFYLEVSFGERRKGDYE